MGEKETVRAHVRPSTNKAVDSYARAKPARQQKATLTNVSRPPAPVVDEVGVVAVDGGKKVNGHFIPNWSMAYRSPLAEPVDLSGLDLSGYDLSGLDLRNVDFTGSNLSNADLSGSDMRGGYVKLTDVNMENAVLDNALISCRFSNVNMKGASARKAYITEATFDNVIIDDADFSEAQISDTRMTGVRANNVNFAGLHMNRVRISESVLVNSQFFDAKLNDIRTSGCDYSGSIFKRVDMKVGDWSVCDFTDCEFDDVKLVLLNLGGSRFTEAQLRDVWVLDVKFTTVDLAYADTSGIRFSPDSRPEWRMNWMPYDYLTFSEAQEALGMDKDDFAVAMWGGDIEVRSNKDLSVQSNIFDAETQHVPQWAIDTALQKQADRKRPV